MERKILVAVDDSIHSKHAVEYAGRMSPVVEDLTYTLLHVQPTVSGYLLDEAKTNLKSRAELKKVIRKNAREARNILEESKTRMVRAGIAPKRIDVATVPRFLGGAKDILAYAEEGLYDAIVVGRRGLSRVQKAFVGSVTAEIVEHSRFIPVWVIDGMVTSNGIMLAVDGSESSLSAIDHLSFMVGKNPQAKVTLFHVAPKIGDYCSIDFKTKEACTDKAVGQGNRRCIDRFYARAKEKFRQAGIHESQIKIMVSTCHMNVSKRIVDEAMKGNYGTVVVGRREGGKAFLSGGVSRHVLDRASNQALWLVPEPTVDTCCPCASLPAGAE